MPKADWRHRRRPSGYFRLRLRTSDFRLSTFDSDFKLQPSDFDYDTPMAIRTELSLRIPNSPGALADVCRLLSQERVNVM